MDFPARKLPRLSRYDYSSPNYYFVTICTGNKIRLFGEAGDLNHFGKVAEDEIKRIPDHYKNVHIDAFVVMPNHIHAVIHIRCDDNAERSRPFPTLSTIIGLYKSGVSRLIHECSPDIQIWQKSFYDEIIRNEKGYLRICQYIAANPLKWKDDIYYTE